MDDSDDNAPVVGTANDGRVVRADVTAPVGVTELAQNAEIIRAMIQDENAMMNNRIGWLNSVEGLLFAALAFAWDKADARLLIIVFCVLGMGVAFSSWRELEIGSIAINTLKKWWEKHGQGYLGPDVIGHRTPYDPYWRLLRAHRALPMFYAIGWAAIGLIHLCRTVDAKSFIELRFSAG